MFIKSVINRLLNDNDNTHIVENTYKTIKKQLSFLLGDIFMMSRGHKIHWKSSRNHFHLISNLWRVSTKRISGAHTLYGIWCLVHISNISKVALCIFLSRFLLSQKIKDDRINLFHVIVIQVLNNASLPWCFNYSNV